MIKDLLMQIQMYITSKYLLIHYGVKTMKNKEKYTNINNPTLIVREVIGIDVKRMQREAEEYFYSNNQKYVLIKTQTLYQYMTTIDRNYKINDQRKKTISRGLKKAVFRELLDNFNKADIKEDVYEDKMGNQSSYFAIIFRNANYLDYLKNKKKNNTIGDYRKVMTSMRLDPILKQDIQSYCRQHGTTMSNLTDRLYRQFLTEKKDGDSKMTL